jgi:RNA polymerase sigma-70 factor (ECF subfamily)
MRTATVNEQASEELFRRAAAGDRAAFDSLADKERAQLDTHVRSHLGAALRRNVDPEDIVQETLLRAFRSISQMEWRGEAAFRSWLRLTAEHVILHAAQTNRRTQSPLDPDVPANDPSPSRVQRRDERFERLRQAIDGLPPDYREVIVLARIERLRIREIAKRMERSEDAVKQLLARALRKLRDSFGDTESLNLPWRSLKDEHPNPGGVEDAR